MKARTNSWAERASAQLALVAVVLTAACSPPAPSISYKSGEIVGAGWQGQAPPPEGWSKVLAIHAGDDPASPGLLGSYHREGDRIIFTPRFAPSPGVKLHVIFQASLDKPAITADFSEAARTLALTTRVAHLYPSADEWPANTLKMYIEFSAPMAAGEAWTHIRVRDEQGRAIEKPFVELDPELWDRSGTRLTVLFDPGRIKRGLVDNETAGPPLMPGRVVTVEVDPLWRDASGAPLAEKFVRTIRVGEPQRTPVEVKDWRVDSPNSASDDLVINFDRPLDSALARRAISVTKDRSPVAGKITLEQNETRWRFTPAAPWPPGRYAIRVDGVIEDLAGNRLGKLFDVDTSDPNQATSATPVAEVAFTVFGR
jgi:hypothetical protein